MRRASFTPSTIARMFVVGAQEVEQDGGRRQRVWGREPHGAAPVRTQMDRRQCEAGKFVRDDSVLGALDRVSIPAG